MDVRDVTVRDAEPDDVDALAALDGAPSAVDHLLRERTVRVADHDGVVGAVAFDADAETVHVTRLWGERRAIHRLLGEPVAFATREGLAVEAVVPEHDDAVAKVLTDAGFREVGAGRHFGGEATRRFRMEP